MCDQTEVSYLPGDIVWVKLAKVWWPGEVQDPDKLDEDVTGGLKKKPLAVVKFFNEDSYEFPKNINQIYHYNCLRKDEFIKKGVGLYRAATKPQALNRSIPSLIDKFPTDIALAEEKTNGNPKYLDDPKFALPTESPLTIVDSPDESPTKKIKLDNDVDTVKRGKPRRSKVLSPANSSKVKFVESPHNPISKVKKHAATPQSILKKKNPSHTRQNGVECLFCDKFFHKYLLFIHLEEHYAGNVPGKLPAVPFRWRELYDKNISSVNTEGADLIDTDRDEPKLNKKKRKIEEPSSPKRKKKVEASGKETSLPASTPGTKVSSLKVGPLKKRRKGKGEDVESEALRILADWDDFSEEEDKSEKVKESSCFDFDEEEDDAIKVEHPLKFGSKLPRVINEKPSPKSKSLSKNEDNLSKEVDSFLDKIEAPKLPEVPSILTERKNKNETLNSDLESNKKKTLDSPVKKNSGALNRSVVDGASDVNLNRKSDECHQPLDTDVTVPNQSPRKPRNSFKLPTPGPRRRSSRLHSNEQDSDKNENEKDHDKEVSPLQDSDKIVLQELPISKESLTEVISETQPSADSLNHEVKKEENKTLSQEAGKEVADVSDLTKDHFLSLDSLKMKPPETPSRTKRASKSPKKNLKCDDAGNQEKVNEQTQVPEEKFIIKTDENLDQLETSKSKLRSASSKEKMVTPSKKKDTLRTEKNQVPDVKRRSLRSNDKTTDIKDLKIGDKEGPESTPKTKPRSSRSKEKSVLSDANEITPSEEINLRDIDQDKHSTSNSIDESVSLTETKTDKSCLPDTSLKTEAKIVAQLSPKKSCITNVEDNKKSMKKICADEFSKVRRRSLRSKELTDLPQENALSSDESTSINDTSDDRLKSLGPDKKIVSAETTELKTGVITTSDDVSKTRRQSPRSKDSTDVKDKVPSSLSQTPEEKLEHLFSVHETVSKPELNKKSIPAVSLPVGCQSSDPKELTEIDVTKENASLAVPPKEKCKSPKKRLFVEEKKELIDVNSGDLSKTKLTSSTDLTCFSKTKESSTHENTSVKEPPTKKLNSPRSKELSVKASSPVKIESSVTEKISISSQSNDSLNTVKSKEERVCDKKVSSKGSPKKSLVSAEKNVGKFTDDKNSTSGEPIEAKQLYSPSKEKIVADSLPGKSSFKEKLIFDSTVSKDLIHSPKKVDVIKGIDKAKGKERLSIENSPKGKLQSSVLKDITKLAETKETPASEGSINSTDSRLDLTSKSSQEMVVAYSIKDNNRNVEIRSSEDSLKTGRQSLSPKKKSDQKNLIESPILSKEMADTPLTTGTPEGHSKEDSIMKKKPENDSSNDSPKLKSVDKKTLDAKVESPTKTKLVKKSKEVETINQTIHDAINSSPLKKSDNNLSGKVKKMSEVEKSGKTDLKSPKIVEKLSSDSTAKGSSLEKSKLQSSTERNEISRHDSPKATGTTGKLKSETKKADNLSKKENETPQLEEARGEGNLKKSDVSGKKDLCNLKKGHRSKSKDKDAIEKDSQRIKTELEGPMTTTKSPDTGTKLTHSSAIKPNKLVTKNDREPSTIIDSKAKVDEPKSVVIKEEQKSALENRVVNEIDRGQAALFSTFDFPGFDVQPSKADKFSSNISSSSAEKKVEKGHEKSTVDKIRSPKTDHCNKKEHEKPTSKSPKKQQIKEEETKSSLDNIIVGSVKDKNDSHLKASMKPEKESPREPGREKKEKSSEIKLLKEKHHSSKSDVPISKDKRPDSKSSKEKRDKGPKSDGKLGKDKPRDSKYDLKLDKERQKELKSDVAPDKDTKVDPTRISKSDSQKSKDSEKTGAHKSSSKDRDSKKRHIDEKEKKRDSKKKEKTDSGRDGSLDKNIRKSEREDSRSHHKRESSGSHVKSDDKKPRKSDERHKKSSKEKRDLSDKPDVPVSLEKANDKIISTEDIPLPPDVNSGLTVPVESVCVSPGKKSQILETTLKPTEVSLVQQKTISGSGTFPDQSPNASNSESCPEQASPALPSSPSKCMAELPAKNLLTKCSPKNVAAITPSTMFELNDMTDSSKKNPEPLDSSESFNVILPQEPKGKGVADDAVLPVQATAQDTSLSQGNENTPQDINTSPQKHLSIDNSLACNKNSGNSSFIDSKLALTPASDSLKGQVDLLKLTSSVSPCKSSDKIPSLPDSQTPPEMALSQSTELKSNPQPKPTLNFPELPPDLSKLNSVRALDPIEPNVSLKIDTGLTSKNNSYISESFDFPEACLPPITSEVTVYTDSAVDTSSLSEAVSLQSEISSQAMSEASAADDPSKSKLKANNKFSSFDSSSKVCQVNAFAPEDLASLDISSLPIDMGLSEDLDLSSQPLIKEICVGQSFETTPGAVVIDVHLRRKGESFPKEFDHVKNRFIIKADPKTQNNNLPHFPLAENNNKTEITSIANKPNGEVKSSTIVKTSLMPPPLVVSQGVHNSPKQVFFTIANKTTTANSIITIPKTAASPLSNVKLVNKQGSVAVGKVNIGKNAAGNIVFTGSGISRTVILKPGTFTTQVSKGKAIAVNSKSSTTGSPNPGDTKPVVNLQPSLLPQKTNPLPISSSQSEAIQSKPPHKSPNILQKFSSSSKSPKKTLGGRTIVKAKGNASATQVTLGEQVIPSQPTSGEQIIFLTMDQHGNCVSTSPSLRAQVQKPTLVRTTPKIVRLQKPSPVKSIGKNQNQDILAEALANTQVLQTELVDVTSSHVTSTQYSPSLSNNVLETSLTLNQPIMTPLEVPSSVTTQGLPVIDPNGQTIYISDTSGFQIIDSSLVVPGEVPSETKIIIPSLGEQAKLRESDNVLPEFLKGDFSNKTSKSKKPSSDR